MSNPPLAHFSPSRKNWLPALTLFLLAMVPFLPAINGEYTWDDDQWLVNNAAVHAWNGLYRIWNPFLQALQFYPVTFSTLWLEHKLWALNPIGYHAGNMLLHAGATLLLWLCLRRLNLRGAWLAALLWAIHPVQADSVAWVAEIKNTLSGLLYFLAAWSYLKFERIGDDSAPSHRQWFFYALGLLAFSAALLSKTVVCTLPAALLILLWWKREKLFPRHWLPLVPWFLLTLSVAAFASWQEHAGLVIGGANDLHFTLPQKLIICGKDLWFYLSTLAFPYPLMAIYPRWNIQSAYVINYLPIAAAVIASIVVISLKPRFGKAPIAAMLFFLVTLSPALGFINFFTMHYTFVADHYQYLACLGILIIPAEILALTRHRLLSQILSALLIAACLANTAFYASLFQSNMKLWSWNVAHNPDAFTAQHNLGTAYLNAGNHDEGVRRIKLALAQQPDDDNIQRTVARLALAAGHYDEALAHIQRATALRPTYGLNYKMLGDIYQRMGNQPAALDAYAKATTTDLTDPLYFIAYAESLKKSHQLDQAAIAYQRAILLAPGNLITRYNYANLLLDLHKPADAITQYQFILQYQDDAHNGPIYHNLAYAYSQINQMPQAVEAEKHANQIDATNAHSAR